MNLGHNMSIFSHAKFHFIYSVILEIFLTNVLVHHNKKTLD